MSISPEMKGIVEAILAYSDRHFKRIDKLVQQSYLLDHTIAAMSVLSAPNGTASTDIMTIDMSSSSSDSSSDSSSSDSNESSSESSRSSDDESSDVEDSISRKGGANAVNKRAATQASTRSSKRLRNWEVAKVLFATCEKEDCEDVSLAVYYFFGIIIITTVTVCSKIFLIIKFCNTC